MIRPNEITYFVINDIDKWLSKDGFEEIEIAEDIGDILMKAILGGYLFDVNIIYEHYAQIVRTIFQSSTPVPREK